MPRKLGNLQSVIAVTGAVLAVGAAAMLSLAVGIRSERQLEREIGRSLSEAAFQMAEKLDTDMWARSNQVAVLARIDALRDATVAQKVVDELKRKDHTLAWVGVLDRDGRIVAASGGILLGADASSRPVFREGIRGHFIGDVHDAVMLAKLLPNPSGEPMKFVDVATPMRNAEGDIDGVLATHFSWGWAREVERTLMRPMQDRRGLEVFIVGADGTTLLGPEGSLGQMLPIHSVGSARLRAIGWAVETWPDGETYLTGYAQGPGHADYRGLGWTVLVRQPVEAAFADAAALRREIFVWGAGFALLFSVAAWFAAGWLARPLRAIADAAVRLRRGEPGVEIPAIGGTAEVADLSASLRDLVASLTDTKVALSRMEDAAYQDRLTALPNRRFLDRYLEAQVSRSDARPFTLLSLDLDGFKPINDTLGHQAGDAVLRHVASRMASCLRGDDVIARLGGDEFVAVLSSCPEGEAAAEVADRLIGAVNEPLVVGGRAVRVGCSIGIAVWPDDGMTPERLLATSDKALYEAKRAGRNRAMFVRGNACRAGSLASS
ncbi:sensor domain-containing diguanylate cyclase [Arenibaculum pallidiluteum]|uniref:sensor domain-containing diguanylate cyclase n=1 Tax=Arenibaculum pallidiluteum TaxID=2812559 RepID=UPI001A967F45|nr:sensor domain-containing diguanylate cyclase [Arenibaculum pallidiluteum]